MRWRGGRKVLFDQGCILVMLTWIEVRKGGLGFVFTVSQHLIALSSVL